MNDWYITLDIEEIKALEDYKIYLKFKNGEEKILDMSYLIHNTKIYLKLKDKDYFKNVKIRKDTIEWENGEDVAPEILYHNSVPIKET